MIGLLQKYLTLKSCKGRACDSLFNNEEASHLLILATVTLTKGWPEDSPFGIISINRMNDVMSAYEC